VGALRDATGSSAIGFSVLAASLVLGGLLVLARGRLPGT
jgi:hypothetical protein